LLIIATDTKESLRYFWFCSLWIEVSVSFSFACFASISCCGLCN